MRPSVNGCMMQPISTTYPAVSAYTFSYSSIASGYTATQAALSDGNQADTGATAFKTLTSDTANELKADLGQTCFVNSVKIGNVSGAAATQINGAILQISNDNLNWTDILTLSGFTATAVLSTILVSLPAKYVRLSRTPSTYRLSVAEFIIT